MHQIQLEKRTIISEVIIRGKRNIKQNTNWFYFKFSVESSSFTLQTKTSLLFAWFYQSVFLSIFVAFHPWTVKQIMTALMPSLLFCCFSLFLPHLRTLAQEKRSQNCLCFGTGGLSLFVSIIVSKYNIFTLLTMAAHPRKLKFMAKRFAHTISMHYRDFEHGYIY